MGGRKINDHSFFAGGMSKDSVLPKGVHVKQESSAEGAGSVREYEDTSEKIKKQQAMSEGKMRAYAQKPHHRY